jgi:ABC-type branched-subunit amino acid transport system substrate-binding protein
MGNMDQLFPKETSFFFSTAPQIVSVFDSTATMIENDWQKKGKAGTPKVGIDIVNAGLAPRIWIKKIELLMAEKGWDYTVTRSSIVAVDMATNVLKMKEFGADYLIISCTESALIAWFNDLDRQNFHPPVFDSTNLASQEMRGAIGESIGGSTFYIFSPQWTDTYLPLVQLVHDLNAEWNPEVTSRPPHFLRAFADTMAVAGAIEKAIENVGYDNIDGNASKEALESLRDYDPIGYGTGYTWTPDDHQGIHGVRWYRWAEDGSRMETVMKEWDIFEPLPQEQRTNDYWLGE